MISCATCLQIRTKTADSAVHLTVLIKLVHIDKDKKDELNLQIPPNKTHPLPGRTTWNLLAMGLQTLAASS